MLDEQELVPYEPWDPTGRKVLVLAPHPDDETFGCGGTLALHVQSGDGVKLVFLTGGGKGGGDSDIESSDLVIVRRREAERAVEVLGIRDVEFWELEDRRLVWEERLPSRIRSLLEEYRPDLCYVPSAMEMHPDHRAAAYALENAIHGMIKSFEVAFYEVGQPVVANTLVDVTGTMELKLRALHSYASQLSILPYESVAKALATARSLTLAPSSQYAEAFFLTPSNYVARYGALEVIFRWRLSMEREDVPLWFRDSIL